MDEVKRQIPAGQPGWLVPNCYERLTPETFKHAPGRRTHYYKVCDGVRYRMTPEEIERLKTVLRHRKENEMPSDHFSRYFDRRPKPVRKENEMPNYATWPPNATSPKVTDFKEVLKENPTASAHLMTPQEVKDRLAAGEDPLLLSVEHWVQNAVHIKKYGKGSLPSVSYKDRTCALCTTFRAGGCKECPLGIAQDGKCDGAATNTAWFQFSFSPSYANAMNMVAVLASLKPPEAAIPQFYIDGEGEGKVALRLAQETDGRIVLKADTATCSGWSLLVIKQDGSIRLPRAVSESTGLDLDDAGRLQLEV